MRQDNEGGVSFGDGASRARSGGTGSGMSSSGEWMRWWRLLQGPGGSGVDDSQSGMVASGGAPLSLRLLEEEEMGQRRFKGRSEDGEVLIRFDFTRARGPTSGGARRDSVAIQASAVGSSEEGDDCHTPVLKE
jgi:hypothetical protein